MTTIRQTRSPKRRWRLMTLLLALSLVGGACSANDEDSSTAGGAEMVADVEAAPESRIEAGGVTAEDAFAADATDRASGPAEESASVGEGSTLGSGGTGVGSLTPVDIGRDIIFTASIEVEVADVAAASAEAVAVIQGLGGFVFGQTSVDDGIPRSTLTFKVRPEDFQTAIAELGEVGVLRSQNITTDDVTERVVDLESRIITAQASVDRLRGFLEGATSLADIAQLEGELLQRETDLELLRGQLRTVEAQVDLATITVSLTQQVPGPELELATTFYVGHDGGAACQGSDDLSVDEGDAVTVCYVVTNSGDTHLADVEVVDATFGLDAGDITRIGDDGIVAPGDQIRFVAEVEAIETRSSASRATGRAVDEAGNDLRQGLVTAAGEARLTVEPDTSLPGFLDGFGAGWAVVLGVVSAVVLAAGFSLPLIWLPVALWWVWRTVLRPRRQARRAARPAEAIPMAAPPAPPTPPAPVPDATAGAAGSEPPSP